MEELRDLEQIRECDENPRARRIGLYVLAAATAASLIFAMTVVVVQAHGLAEDNTDPLNSLAEAASLPQEEATADDESPRDAQRRRASEQRDVAEEATFPTRLLDPPEQRDHESTASDANAIMAAASAEHELLPIAANAGETPHAAREVTPAAAVAPMALPATLPASIATGGTRSELLARTVREDQLVANSVAATVRDEEPTAPERADEGRDGRYTLQVISYQRPELATAFADALRDRGHTAFVVEGEIPNRGTHYRVRIGPFQTQHQANAYRRTFERDEQMATLVIQKRDDEEG